jgi:hypothetical protein
MFGQDNKVVTRWSLRATHLAPYHDIPATGLKIHAEGIHIERQDRQTLGLQQLNTRPICGLHGYACCGKSAVGHMEVEVIRS